jgi:hypothetical protein
MNEDFRLFHGIYMDEPMEVVPTYYLKFVIEQLEKIIESRKASTTIVANHTPSMETTDTQKMPVIDIEYILDNDWSRGGFTMDLRDSMEAKSLFHRRICVVPFGKLSYAEDLITAGCEVLTNKYQEECGGTDGQRNSVDTAAELLTEFINQLKSPR